MTTGAIPFAGLAPDPRVLRSGGEITGLDLRAASGIAHALRRAVSATNSTTEVARAVVDAIHSLEHQGRSASVLVSAYLVRPALGSSRGDPIGPPIYLELVCSRGIEVGWDQLERASAGARPIPYDAAQLTPWLSLRLRLDDPAQPAAQALCESNAATSPNISDKSFVRAYGVESVLALSLLAWPGECLVFVAFSRAPLFTKVAVNFEVIALYARLGWLESGQATARFADASRERLRSEALQDLLTWQETHHAELLLSLRRQLEQAQDDAHRATSSSSSRLEAQNKNLSRTQRAMLNVIEDLREAREALASKVELRTQELSIANSQLEVRNRDLEEFVYIASHDLQEPLRTIVGYLQMVERRYRSKLDAEGEEFIAFAVGGAQRMQALLDSLLFYSRVASKEKRFARVRLDDALSEALQNLALSIEETGASIVRTPLPTIDADHIQMVQLFQNLISNALKFCGTERPRISISGSTSEDASTVRVRDEGIGFNPLYVDRIFKLFRRLRRDTPGTGIGLAVCKKIAERHGGRIEAESSLGGGSTFSVILPTFQAKSS